MPDYTAMILDEFRSQDWEVAIQSKGDRFIATAQRDGHTCIGESDGELGALIALKDSVRHHQGDQGKPTVRTAKISSANGQQFSKAVYVFGFESFLAVGRGLVVLLEGDMTRHEDTRVDAKLHYMTVETHGALMPKEAIEFVEGYQAEREVVFTIATDDGTATALVLKLEDM